MTQESKWNILRHDIKAKSLSLRSAADLIKDCPTEEKRQIIALMSEAAEDLTRYVAELGKELERAP
ncbi:MAG: hypothetical protein WCU88_08855 [Elusimicrobiota bacterium]